MSARRIPLSRRNHITGWHPVRPSHASVPFESTLERDTVTWLVQQPGFHHIEAQPITIHYQHSDGDRRRYTPDYYVIYTELTSALKALGFAHQTYIEVKYAEDAAKRVGPLTQQGEAIRQHTGCPLVILTEDDVRAHGKPRLLWDVQH